jgi:hypothetical protein
MARSKPESDPHKACTSLESRRSHWRPKARRRASDTHGRIERSEEAEADENHGNPKNEHDEERHGYRGGSLFINQPPGLGEDTQSPLLEGTLRVVLRRKSFYVIVQNFGAMGRHHQLWRDGALFRPHLNERLHNRTAQYITGFFRVWPVMGQDAVQHHNLA